jgi:energy-coupling factor transporter ATP-binding protein EcfA2
MISHDLDFVAKNFDRVIQLRQGRVWQDLPARLFFEKIGAPDDETITIPQIPRLCRVLGHPHLALTMDEFLINQRDNPQ